jgi:hypothetical protein
MVNVIMLLIWKKKYINNVLLLFEQDIVIISPKIYFSLFNFASKPILTSLIIVEAASLISVFSLFEIRLFDSILVVSDKSSANFESICIS